MTADFILSEMVLSELETRILEEKAKGLSDLEVAHKLWIYESYVRSITRKHKARYARGSGKKVPDDRVSHLGIYPDNEQKIEG